jgi:hypothetical protein
VGECTGVGGGTLPEGCEELLADPDVTELEFVRLSGGFWEWHVRPLRRNDAGAWEPD